MEREADIQSLCEQVKKVQLEVNQNNWYASCPFCGNGNYGISEMEQVKHEQHCAYLIAKDLSTK